MTMPDIPHGESLIALAARWVAFIEREAFDSLWDMCSSSFRLAVVQRWIEQNPELLDVPDVQRAGVEAFAEETAGDPTSYLALGLRSFFIRSLLHLMGSADWGPSVSVRVISPSIEAVVLVDRNMLSEDESGQLAIPPGAVMPVIGLFFDVSGESPLVCGFPSLVKPGWPPRKVDVDLNSY